MTDKIKKAATKTIGVHVTSFVSVIANFILVVIRTKIFGRASYAKISGAEDATTILGRTAPRVISGAENIVEISGRSSGVSIGGYPEPIDPEEF